MVVQKSPKEDAVAMSNGQLNPLIYLGCDSVGPGMPWAIIVDMSMSSSTPPCFSMFSYLCSRRCPIQNTVNMAATTIVVQPTAMPAFAPVERLFEAFKDDAALVLVTVAGSDDVVADTGDL